MKAKPASSQSNRGPLPRVLRPLAGPFSRVYTSEISRRNKRWDAGQNVVTIDRPVISVGNLSVGGTGKTPMVAAICHWLLDADHHPAIAMRGYAATNGLSDEADEYRRSLGDSVPVVAQPDRLEGLLRLFAQVGDDVDCVVLDDGFQHRRIARGLDIVLIDASRDPFSDSCLPAGWLREPVASLVRADAVVLTHAELVDEAEIGRLRDLVHQETDAKVCLAAHRWGSLNVSTDSQDQTEPVDWLNGKRIFAACAIGNPAGFLSSAKAASGGSLEGSLVLTDHDRYRPKTIDRLIAAAQECDAIVVTEKDWSKLARVEASRWPCPVARASLAMGFIEGESVLRQAVLGCAAGED